MREYTEQELVRREKAKKLLEKNIDPFGSKYDITSDSKCIKEVYSEFTDEELEPKYKSHNLVNNKIYSNCKECHIRPDWLLIYTYFDNQLILLIVETGSHSELFK